VPGTPNPSCLVAVEQGDNLIAIARSAGSRLAVEVSVAGLQRENQITDPDVVEAGDVLDVCVDNQIDDTTGDVRPPPTTTTTTTTAPPPTAPEALIDHGSGVSAQQAKLNDLLTPYGYPALIVDGRSGPRTRQALCAVRLGMGLSATRSDMDVGSDEEQQLRGTRLVGIPPDAPTTSSRWVLIDQTCQVLYAGQGDAGIVFVLPVSTGEEGFETRNQPASAAFRFDPALDNGGWHESTEYPVGIDNPLNGNMYKPVYFDQGQAIHGANTVPPAPASKGCVRLSIEHQDRLLGWLGIGTRELWSVGDIGLTVTVQGDY
jgi:hypothetical protein